MDLDFLQHEYDAESERRDQLQSAAGTPMAVLTLLGSAIIYLLQKFEAKAPALVIPFWTLIVVSGVSYAVSVYMLVRSYFGYTYRRIPLPSQLSAYESQLRAYLASLGALDHLVVEADVRENLSTAYMDAVDRNAVNNTNRGAYLHKANAASVVALVFAALAAVPLAIYGRTASEKPERESLINEQRPIMTDQKNNNQQSKPAETKPATPAPERPRFPKNQDVRTGTREPKKTD